MFIISAIKESVALLPHTQSLHRHDAVFNQLEITHVGKMINDVGLCVAIYDVVRMGDAIVHAGEGCARCEVLFNAVIFRPFVGEICRGKIAGCTPEGITLTLGFFDSINVAPHRLQNPSFFDVDGEKTWVWNCNGELAPYDVDDDVFFLVCSVDFERVSSVSQVMNIHASMEFDGLGPRRQASSDACIVFHFSVSRPLVEPPCRVWLVTTLAELYAAKYR